jgi:LacI family transcriptional regulator
MPRPTIADIARAAGVGVATVDRVINARRAVRPATAERVLKAAEAVGYYATGLIRRRMALQLPERVFGLVLQKHDDPLYQGIAAAFVAALTAQNHVRGRTIVEFVDELTPSLILAALRRVAEQAHAVGCVSVDHPEVSRAIRRLRDRGIPVFALLSDLDAPARAGYVGLDSRAVGRTAACLMARMARREGTVGVFVGSARYRGQGESVEGFRTYFAERAAGFRLTDTAFNLDDPRVAHEATLELLKHNDDLVGIYDAGGGRHGIIAALRAEARGRDLAVICNELTATTRQALTDGIITCVLALPVEALARATVEEMIAATTGERGKVRERPVRHILELGIYVSENIA